MDETSQFCLFKDTIARYVLSGVNDQQADQGEEGTELDEFVSYLASEAWPTVPAAAQDATYDTREKVPEIDEIPLESTSIAFIDSLISYGIVEDADDAYRLFRRILDDYRDQACAPPPVWSSTRTTECEICAREVPLTYHHLIPRAAHAKVLKQGWHPESMINSVAWLCRPCHTMVHKVASPEKLAREFYTVELLLGREDIQKWQKYAAKQRHGIRHR